VSDSQLTVAKKNQPY